MWTNDIHMMALFTDNCSSAALAAVVVEGAFNHNVRRQEAAALVAKVRCMLAFPWRRPSSRAQGDDVAQVVSLLLAVFWVAALDLGVTVSVEAPLKKLAASLGIGEAVVFEGLQHLDGYLRGDGVVSHATPCGFLFFCHFCFLTEEEKDRGGNVLIGQRASNVLRLEQNFRKSPSWINCLR